MNTNIRTGPKDKVNSVYPKLKCSIRTSVINGSQLTFNRTTKTCTEKIKINPQNFFSVAANTIFSNFIVKESAR